MNFAEWGGTQDLATTHEGTITVRKVRINSGGYSDDGSYFGIGNPVYSVTDEEGLLDCYIRAKDREDARATVLAQFPKAKIRR